MNAERREWALEHHMGLVRMVAGEFAWTRAEKDRERKPS